MFTKNGPAIWQARFLSAGFHAGYGEQSGMKLGVSTLGCPDWTLDEILTRLPGYGYEGVELRGLGPDLDLTKSPAFDTAAIEETRRRFADAGLVICGVDTSCAFTDPDKAVRERSRRDAEEAIILAHRLEAATVRVFGGGIAKGVTRADAVGHLVENLAALANFVADSGSDVVIVLETHDAFSTGSQVAEVLRQVDHPCVRALWDLHHPYRQGEAPAETFAALAPYVEQTHVKDSTPGGTYCLLGEGDIPILEMLRLLKSGQEKGGGYDGWINLEWEKRWNPSLPDPSVAFPQYAARLRQYLDELS